MEWLLKFNCEFDEGDDDLKSNHGYIYPPEGYSEPHTRVKGEDVWLIDDTNKESMKLLAMFNYAVKAEFGEDGNDDYGDHSESEITASLKANETLKTMGVTDDEIDQFMKHYSIYDYWPTTEYDPHNHEFELTLVPVKHQPTEIDEDFLTRLWK